MTTLGKRPHNEENASHSAQKRPYLEHAPDKRLTRFSNDSYEVAWLCALPLEMAAAEAMLDEVHDHNIPKAPKDDNSYVLGRIDTHNVVISCLPNAGYGMNNAVAVAISMNASFPNLRYRFMVGIGGGVPRKVDVRLGDVVVSNAVIQYDLGKTVQGGRFERKSDPQRPPQSLLTAVSRLRSKHIFNSTSIPNILCDLLQRNPQMRSYAVADHLSDKLYQGDYDHNEVSRNCDSCDETQLIYRIPRDSSCPQIHYGSVASANQVMKHGQSRDKLADELDIICYEMEAAGLMSNFPCLVVRGICDYADSHKNNQWQDYAAGVAAAYTKELLSVISSSDGQKESMSAQLATTPIPDNGTAESQEQIILDTLKFEHLESRHASIKIAHTTTCEWLLHHPCYTSWIDPTALHEHHGFLWIKGKPGAGKSTLMKYAFTKAKKGSVDDAVIISFFFNARGDALEKSTTGMYRSLLVQVFENIPGLLKSLNISDLVGKYSNGGLDWSIEDLTRLFSDAVGILGSRPLTCFIDALDECDEDQIKLMVEEFDRLGKEAQNSGSQLYICFSSRHYPQVVIPCGREIILEDQTEHSEDLEKYVRSKLRVGSGKLINEVRAEILRKAVGVFLWVVLVVEILNDEFRKGRIFAVKRRLQEIPPKLSELFKDILLRDNQNLEDLFLCIQWILFSKRPLKREEFYFAILYGLEPDSGTAAWDHEITTPEDMNRFVRNSSKGLAEVTRSKSGVVQFIHESVRDFLIKDNGIAELWPDLGSNFESNSHDQLKRCCHSYLIADDFGRTFTTDVSQENQNLKTRRENIGKILPFLEYATCFILHHADAAALSVDQSTFLETFELPSWVGIHNLFVRGKINGHGPSVPLEYVAAVYDLPELVPAGYRCYDTESPEERYKTPLFAAIANGSWRALGALIGLSPERLHEINEQVTGSIGANFKAVKSGDPMDWAVQENVPGLLLHLVSLRRQAQGFNKTVSASALIIRALQLGNHLCVLILLENSIDTITQYTDGSHALHVAAIIGSLGIISTLLEKGHDINVQNGVGATPLHLAAKSPRAGAATISLLLEAGADIEALDNTERSPLHWAIIRGATPDAVAAILSANPEPNSKDCQGLTPLHEAAVCKGIDPEIFAMLLQAGHDINYQCSGGMFKGQTPLYRAMKIGCRENSRILIERGAGFDINDPIKREMLDLAVENDLPDIAHLLLQNGVDVGSLNKDISTRLLQQSIRASMRDFSLLLVNQVTEFDFKRYGDDAPAHLAVKNGFVDVAIAVLDRGGVLPDIRCCNCKSPPAIPGNQTLKPLLFCAMTNEDIQMVRMLLDKGADPNSHGTDVFDHHALSWLSSPDISNLKIVELLLERGLDLCHQDLSGQRPLHLTIQTGRDDISELLLNYGAPIGAQNHLGWTPLHLAASRGSESSIRLLCKYVHANSAMFSLSRSDVNIEDIDGWTAWDVAWEKAHMGICEILESFGAISGRDSLWLAVGGSNWDHIE